MPLLERPRSVVFALTALLSLPLVAGLSSARASSGMGGPVDEQHYTIEVIPGIERTELLVTRTFFNPTLFAAEIELDLRPGCDAALDDLAVQEPDGKGGLRWAEGVLLDPKEADARWDQHLWGGADLPPDQLAVNADTAVRLTRTYGCDASLDIYPIPPLQTRTIRYRIAYVPSYADGQYTVELPNFAEHQQPASLQLLAAADPSVGVEVDGAAASAMPVLDGDLAHTLTMRVADPGRGLARVADLDFAALGAGSSRRWVDARFDAPQELAAVPGVRRVTLVIDNSRSAEHSVSGLIDVAVGYLEALAEEQPGARVEVLFFDRDLRRLYFDFVSPRWAAEDLGKLEIGSENGSEVGLALASARALLSEADALDPEPPEQPGIARADWIVLLSDLDLRSDFDLPAEQAAAARAGVRMHVIRDDAAELGRNLAPAELGETWTTIAMDSGGMGWRVDPRRVDQYDFGFELLAPRRLWDLELVRERADGSVVREPLSEQARIGESQQWDLLGDEGEVETTRVSFTGAAWGQPRSWTAGASEAHGKAIAAALAVNDDTELEPHERAALAFHAEVVSPFTVAYALASFEGPPASPPLGGFGSFSSRCGGHSTRCGGALGTGRSGIPSSTTLADLIAEAIDQCPASPAGQLQFEVTAPEIVAVDSLDRCLEEAIWGIDLRWLPSVSDGLVVVRHQGGAAPGQLDVQTVDVAQRRTLQASLR